LPVYVIDPNVGRERRKLLLLFGLRAPNDFEPRWRRNPRRVCLPYKRQATVVWFVDEGCTNRHM